MWRHVVTPGTSSTTVWLDVAARTLADGGVVAYPTDTLYGLGADPRDPQAIARLYRIKGRGVDQALPLIAGSLGQLRASGAVLSPLALRLAQVFWPGPLTLVLGAWPGLCADTLAGRDTVAVRVPDHPVAIALAGALGYPITSTSANRSGDRPTADPDEVGRVLGADLDGLVDGGRCPGGLPSTIVDASGPVLRLLRAGVIAWDRVLESVE